METTPKDGDNLVRKWQDMKALEGALTHSISLEAMIFIFMLTDRPVHHSLICTLDHRKIRVVISRN